MMEFWNKANAEIRECAPKKLNFNRAREPSFVLVSIPRGQASRAAAAEELAANDDMVRWKPGIPQAPRSFMKFQSSMSSLPSFAPFAAFLSADEKVSSAEEEEDSD